MAWNLTNPTDTEKIRNLGTVIRPNWVAIEQADSSFQPQAINLTDRTVAGVSSDPTAISDAYLIYSKTDSAGNPELFGINESSEVIQFTKGIPVLAQADSSTFLAGGLILKMGLSTFSAASLSKTVTYSAAFPTGAYGVTATLVGGSTTFSVSGTSAAADFTIVRTSGSVAGQSFHWIAWGV